MSQPLGTINERQYEYIKRQYTELDRRIAHIVSQKQEHEAAIAELDAKLDATIQERALLDDRLKAALDQYEEQHPTNR